MNATKRLGYFPYTMLGLGLVSRVLYEIGQRSYSEIILFSQSESNMRHLALIQIEVDIQVTTNIFKGCS